MSAFSTKNIVAGLATLGLLVACAQNYQPVVDLKGVKADKYQNDLAECRQLAAQVDTAGDSATNGLIGAAGGAALGAALGAITGNAGTGAALGAVTGVAGGAGGTAVSAEERKKKIINNCLSGRGYKVLG